MSVVCLVSYDEKEEELGGIYWSYLTITLVSNSFNTIG